MVIIYIKKNEFAIFSDKHNLDEYYLNDGFKKIILDDKYSDCDYCDFNEDLSFNPVKYQTRKTIELSKQKIEELEKKLKDYDYIGVKIATGRGTIEDYKNQIAEMTDWANQINSLKNYLKTLD